MPKKILILMVFALILASCSADEKQKGKVEHLNQESFRQNVFDYENNPEWKFEGKLPVIIDFYADWCGPCQRVAPIMEELAVEYDGRIKIYKVDTDEQKELAAMFGIRSIPSILFIPGEGQPQMHTGAFPKENYVKLIEEVLGVK